MIELPFQQAEFVERITILLPLHRPFNDSKILICIHQINQWIINNLSNELNQGLDYQSEAPKTQVRSWLLMHVCGIQHQIIKPNSIQFICDCCATMYKIEIANCNVCILNPLNWCDAYFKQQQSKHYYVVFLFCFFLFRKKETYQMREKKM